MRRQLFSHIDTEVNAVAALRRDGLLRRESCTRIRAWVGNGRLHGSTLELSPRWECGRVKLMSTSCVTVVRHTCQFATAVHGIRVPDLREPASCVCWRIRRLVVRLAALLGA